MGLPLTPSAALHLDPTGDSAAHSSPCTFSLKPPAELRQNKQPKRSPDHYICNKYKQMRLIFTFVPNWRCFELSSEDSVSTFIGCFCF